MEKVNPIKPMITIGPIIGKVDDSSARILIEVNQDIELTINLKEIDSNKIIPVTNFCSPKYPEIFKFFGLKSLTRYQVIIENDIDFSKPELKNLTSKFRTTSKTGESPKNFNIGFISCFSSNYYNTLEKPEFSLWNSLSDKVRSEEVNYLFHLGDQIYSDDGFWKGEKNSCYAKSFDLWKKTYLETFGVEYSEEGHKKKEEDDPKTTRKISNLDEKKQKFDQLRQMMETEIVENISDVYRKSWNIIDCANVLRNVPNLMILDDHEIYDDFGFDGKYVSPLDTERFENFYADKARLCYYKYQKQLNEDVDFINYQIADKEHHSHIINDVGFFVQDFRGCFSWLKNPQNEGTKGKLDGFLGKSQAQEIQNCFGQGGKFEKTKFSFYISANPLVFFSHFLTSIAEKKIDDCKEQWAFGFRDEQIELLDILANFKKNNAINTMCVSGDVHIGCLTYIFKKDEYVFPQMITSPICQKPPTNFEMSVVDILRFSQKELQDGYSFEHTSGTNECNYGIVKLRKNDNGTYNAFAQHIISNGERFSVIEEELNEFYQKSSHCCGCGIF